VGTSAAAGLRISNMCAAIFAAIDTVAMVTVILLLNILRRRRMSSSLLTDEANGNDGQMTSPQQQHILAPLKSEIIQA